MYYLREKFIAALIFGGAAVVAGNKAANSPGSEYILKPAVVTHKMIVPQGESRADLVLVFQLENGERGSMDVDKVSYATREPGDKIQVKRTSMQWTHNDAQESHQSSMIAIMMITGIIAFLCLCSMVII